MIENGDSKRYPMRLTAKDQELIKKVEAWNYLTIAEIQLLTGNRHREGVQWRLKRLVHEGFLNTFKTPYGDICATKKFKFLDVGGHNHLNLVKRVAQHIDQNGLKNPTTGEQIKFDGYKTEHQLRQEEDLTKYPDLVLLKGSYQIAIEIELTQKSVKRVKKIFEIYTDLLVKKMFVQVVYYCASDAILNQINKVAKEKGLQNHLTAELLTNLLPDVKHEG